MIILLSTENVSSTKSVKISATNPKPSTLPPYVLTPISGMGIPVITLTFGPSSQVNKYTQLRNSDATTPCTSHPSTVKVTKIDTHSNI